MKNADRKTALAILGIVLLAAASVAHAQADTPATTSDDTEVYVYTNADIEALEPIPSQDKPMFEQDLDFADVQAFIAEQYARLQAERQYQLERALTEDALENRRPGYGLAVAPLGYWGHRYGKSRAQRIFEKSVTDYANRMVPLHARTSLIEPLINTRTRNRARVGRGVDAIPYRRPAARGSGRNLARPTAPRRSVAHGFNTAVER